MLALSRDLDVPYKTAFVLAHKLREAMASATKSLVVGGDGWNSLHTSFAMQRINHQKGYSIAGACTNGAEAYFSQLRRGELGHPHHIAGPYLARYAQEAAWREDLRRSSKGEQVSSVATLAMRCTPSVNFCGYWQRAQAQAVQ